MDTPHILYRKQDKYRIRFGDSFAQAPPPDARRARRAVREFSYERWLAELSERSAKASAASLMLERFFGEEMQSAPLRHEAGAVARRLNRRYRCRRFYVWCWESGWRKGVHEAALGGGTYRGVFEEKGLRRPLARVRWNAVSYRIPGLIGDLERTVVPESTQTRYCQGWYAGMFARPFAETLRGHGLLSVAAPPEELLALCVQDPEQLRLAAMKWREASRQRLYRTGSDVRVFMCGVGRVGGDLSVRDREVHD